MTKKREIQSSVKDESLIEKRREQMIRGAVTLFKEKGFHRTTTREIAKAAGFSIGTLYEYIRTKEDVLYLVCDSIYDEVNMRLGRLDLEKGSIESLVKALEQYYTLIDEMQDEFVVMYQESKSLPKDALRYVLTKEMEMTKLFERLLANCVASGELSLKPKEIVLASHHLFVQGQMWAFRRWAMNDYTIQEFIEMQTKFLLQGMAGEKITIQGA
ncbi:TetR/AcrR family transcriptional regulator [Planococcus sp. ISL-109]|uniref:TetR/AcrR family transcriptional regulator n=1 Tax=Planococcus sp. ISL-109 TaxID=2819166 RepID=UPI001BEB6D8E|nr:TetR/AcrR family transcriptional regulator [Planococcus sp. ISL-109]MBT2583016.1 TetR/AcrR family transcriptional regulator [Planococcus sp. ISL-109]